MYKPLENPRHNLGVKLKPKVWVNYKELSEKADKVKLQHLSILSQSCSITEWGWGKPQF